MSKTAEQSKKNSSKEHVYVLKHLHKKETLIIPRNQGEWNFSSYSGYQRKETGSCAEN